MAKSLEQYTAEATQAYLPSQQAIQNQLGSLDAAYKTGEEKINRQYAQQQSQLENQRNQAAEAASLQAAGSGGSFGGAANIANRKYYEQSFVPAQTQLQTNQSNDLDTLRQNIENQRTSLNSQLANLQAQANQQALQQYWAEVEAERNRAAQLAAAKASAAAASPYSYLPDGYPSQGGQTSNSRTSVDFGTWLNNYYNGSKSTKQFYNNILNTVGRVAKAGFNNTGLANNATNKISNTPIWQEYLAWQKGQTYTAPRQSTSSSSSSQRYLPMNQGAKLGITGRL